jgi:cysteine desulfurase/selenocysteine lyase
VANALGTVVPLREIGELARRHRVPWLVDGAQAVAHLPVDVQALGCDFYAFSGHKLYGPTGIGVLYGREALLAEMPPWQGGGDMILTVSIESSTWNELPFKFEAGTPNISGAIGLGAAIEFVNGLGLQQMAAHEHRLAARAERELLALPGVRIIGTAPHKAAVISFTLAGVHPHDIGTILDAEGVAIRTGHHCAMPVMEFYGLAATARASFACYNTDDDVTRLVAAVSKVREVFR